MLEAVLRPLASILLLAPSARGAGSDANRPAMTEIRNIEMDPARFRTRVFAVSMLLLVCFSLLIARAGLSAGHAP